MRAWKKWSNKRSEGRILIDVSLTRQFVKRMVKKAWELIKQRNGGVVKP